MVLRKVRDHLPRRFFEDDEAHHVMAAQHSWERASNAYHVACIMGEFKQAEAELAADMSEAGLVRFMELRAQLDALERDRDRLYREGVPEAI